MARLVWRRNAGGGQTFLIGDSVLLGRESGVDCVLDTKSVSRRHAKLELRELDYYITDLGSTNGTLVNGERIQEATRLGSGDLIQLGDEVLEFHGEPGASPATQLTRGSLLTAPMETRQPDAADPKAQTVKTPVEKLPRRLGKFYLLHRLGAGGMGAVYHAIDLDSNREVAVKLIRTQLGRNEAFLDFFHNREAVLAREINHPNVIRIFEHGVDGEQHYISMEYVVGQNLYHVLKRRRPSPAEILEILRQVACGLVAAHRQGVVHSDIKPANILLVGESNKTPDYPPEPTGATEPLAEPRDGILEFDAEAASATPPAGPSTARYDPALLEEIRKRVGTPPRDVILDPPFFQRPSELRFLRHYVEKMHEGRGYLIVVEGEAGCGKKRLVSELVQDLRSPAPVGGKPEGAPLTCLELDCGRIEGIPQLHAQVFGLPPAAKAALRQVGEEVTTQLAASTHPILIRLLNLGGATPVTCDWLASLGPILASQKLLVVGTVAPDELRQNGNLKVALERLTQHTKALYLRPLTEYQIQRFLQQLFRDSLTGIDLVSDLYRLSSGNFARLLEILRGFFDRGVLSIHEPAGRLRYRPRTQELELEQGKNLYERFRGFGKVEQRVLEQAAFIGPRFVFDALLKLNDLNETSLFFIVRTLLAEGFFVEEGRTWYGFTNVAFQRYMAERVPEQERAHFHRRISRILQNVQVPESPELYQLRARHLAGCHEYARAVQLLLEGAHLARCEYRADLSREMAQEVLRLYRFLARREDARKEVTGILREWFRKDGNWYELLGDLASDQPTARVKIADFGISFRMTDDERGYKLGKRPVLGTPRYMAPERNKEEYGGFKSDVFSLGIIAHELMVGEPPFPELKGNDVITAHREYKISLPPEVLKRYPAGMEALFNGMVERDPQRRWDAERVVREISKLELDFKAAGSR